MSQDAGSSGRWSRREFVVRVAQGALVAGATTVASSSLSAAEKNPFAYDVSRFAKTDPHLIGWEEIARVPVRAKDARRIAFGPDGVLHIATRNGILRHGPAGAFEPIDLDGPAECVAIAADGTRFVGLRDHIELFDSRGNRRARWDVPAKRTWLSSLAVGASDVFAADSGNRVILRYDRSGKLLGRIGAKDPARNIPGLIAPSPNIDVKLHPDGLLRVTNPGRHRFEAYTFDGDLEAAWGKPSAAIDGFCGCCNPVGLAILPDGRVVTCEKGLPRVKVIGTDGELESVVAGTESFAANRASAEAGDITRGGLDAAVDDRGRIHVLDRIASEIRVLQRKAGA